MKNRLMEGNTMRLVCYDVNFLQHFAFNEIQILSWSTYIRGKEKGQIITLCIWCSG